MRKVGLVTSYIGNVGSELQCYATQVILSRLGYQAVLLTQHESTSSRLRTRLCHYQQFLFGCIRNPQRLRSLVQDRQYTRITDSRIGAATKEAMSRFASRYLKPEPVSMAELTRRARTPEYVAFLSGSDQMWHARGPYLNPVPFLRFAPREKRIAWAPSFGATEIPAYFRSEIAEYISSYSYLSVREQAGATIIKNLTGKEAEVLVDPTLQLSNAFWRQASAEHSELTGLPARYIFLYFLSPPNSVALETVKQISMQGSYELVTMFDDCDDWSKKGGCRSVTAGPFDFISLIAHAALVCTDSFHGTALSINLNTPFLCFNRAYGSTLNDQSSRLLSILSICGLENRLLTKVPDDVTNLLKMDFTKSNKTIVKERNKAIEYLSASLAGVETATGVQVIQTLQRGKSMIHGSQTTRSTSD